MEATEFSADCPGRLVPTTFQEYLDGPQAEPTVTKTVAFVPDPLPPSLDWNAIRLEHFDRYADTVAALGKVNGLHKRVGNASGLLRTLWMREAKLSSEVEDIHTTAEDLVLAGAGRARDFRDGSRESWNYVQALEHGISSQLPWSVHIIREMHRLLLENVRGENLRPGEFRNRGVFIGSHGGGAARARFVPMPAGPDLMDAMRNLEVFVNSTHPLIPPLFVVALTHYQFETIHPFSDGNGRIGRVLISRSLVKEGLLEHPVVYMSAYVKDHRRRYTDLLLRISQEGGQAWSDWIGFVLDAIRTQALDAIWRSEELVTLQASYHESLKADGAPTRLFPVVDDLFYCPAINVAELIEKTRTSKMTGNKDIGRLQDLGILREYTGRERDRDWLAQAIVNVIVKEPPAGPEDTTADQRELP